MFDNILIIGCGLIGSSILRAVREKDLSTNISVYDNSKEVLSFLKKENFNVDIKSDIREATKEAELIIIAAPLNAYKEIFLAIKNNLKKKCYNN